MKTRKTLSVYVLLVGVMGLLIVGGVVVFQVFSEATKSQLTKEQKDAVKPLDGQIDSTIILNLSKRDIYSTDELTTEISPSTPPSLAKTATRSSEPKTATISAQTASQSADITNENE
jgi:cytoskeletal protein RodZ